eukprot:6209694-Pyramimonas_sp.AAC.1
MHRREVITDNFHPSRAQANRLQHRVPLGPGHSLDGPWEGPKPSPNGPAPRTKLDNSPPAATHFG